MKNIQLEALSEVLTQLESKRIFLYLDNPSVEPEYITISGLFDAIDTKFGLDDIIKQMKQALQKFDVYDLHFDSIDTSIAQMQGILSGLNSDNTKLKEDVASLLENMTKVLGDLSLQAAKIEANKNNIITLQDNVSILQEKTQKLQDSIGDSGASVNEQFTAIAWRKM